jgi:hypothetical protein
MAAVVFAFGAKPGIPEHDALELADLLAGRRVLAANSAAEKIREQARRDPDRGETSEDIELDEDELELLAAVLEDEPWPKEQSWYDYLHDQLARGPRRG